MPEPTPGDPAPQAVTAPPGSVKPPNFILAAVTNVDGGVLSIAIQVNTVEGLRGLVRNVIAPRAAQLGYSVELVPLPPTQGGAPRAL